MKVIPCGTHAAMVLLASTWAPLYGQLSLDGYPVQIHGFFSQGFLYSNNNNYLTAPTTSGSFALTDGGLNISSQISGRFRVGAQGYVRKVGNLGEGHVTLDWAYGDYRFSDWFGVRAGRVKTVSGLYTDTQDMEFLHTWALLPQSLYPLDLRGVSISHLGGDAYGSIPVKHAGTFSYTIFGGKAPPDPAGGEAYGLESFGFATHNLTGRTAGADVKWSTPLTGLLLGTSFLDSTRDFGATSATLLQSAPTNVVEHRTVFSAQFSRGPWRIEYERSRETGRILAHGLYGPFGPPELFIPYDPTAWYAAAAYRFSKHFEAGLYHSRYYANGDNQVAGQPYLPPEQRHIYDQAITGRFDFLTHWDLKIEGHFMNGYGDPGNFRGFYPQDNPQGLVPKTNLLVLRLGFNL